VRAWSTAELVEPWARDELIYLNQKHSARQTLQRKRTFQVFAIAAVAVLAVMLWPLFSGYSETYETAPTEQSRLALPDGSRLHLNVDTQLDVHYSSNQRSIVLNRGEGFFDVEHDPQRQFIVSAGGFEITAIGTRFAIRLFPDESLQVVVTEGRVAVAPQSASTVALDSRLNVIPTDEFFLSANEQLTLASSIGTASIEHVKAAHVTAWSESKLIFESTPLSEVAEELSRYVPERIVVSKTIADQPITGVFQIDNVEDMLGLLAEVSLVEAIKRRPNEFLLRQRTTARVQN